MLLAVGSLGVHVRKGIFSICANHNIAVSVHGDVIANRHGYAAIFIDLMLGKTIRCFWWHVLSKISLNGELAGTISISIVIEHAIGES